MNTQWKFKAIGTSWTIDLKLPKDLEENLLKESILASIEEFDKTYSRFRTDSLVYKISQEKGKYIFPEDSKKLFQMYEKLYKLTKGKVTPLIGSLLSESGYDKDYSLVEKNFTDVPKWEDAMHWKFPVLTTHRKIELDFGACGKGYLVDIIAEILVKNNVSDYVIDAGGDIRYFTTSGKKIRVGLENPSNPREVIGTTDMINKSIAGSATNRRRWGKFHHIIDPDTKKSPEHIIALWSIASDTITADASTTAIFFQDPYEVSKILNCEYFIVKDDLSIQK